MRNALFLDIFNQANIKIPHPPHHQKSFPFAWTFTHVYHESIQLPFFLNIHEIHKFENALHWLKYTTGFSWHTKSFCKYVDVTFYDISNTHESCVLTNWCFNTSINCTLSRLRKTFLMITIQIKLRFCGFDLCSYQGTNLNINFFFNNHIPHQAAVPKHFD